MKRVFLSVVLIVVCGLATAYADNTVRIVQTQLKASGFYFGKVNGDYDSETAAAVSRFQIRNGLPISGQVDADTAKALGVVISTNDPPPGPPSDTWQRLRRTDPEFLRNAPGAKKQAAPPASAQNADAASNAAPLQPLAADGSTFVLSRDRLQDYIAAFVLAGLDPNVGSELAFFGNSVNYFGDGLKDRGKIRSDLMRYDQQWPRRRFRLAGPIDVQPQPDSRIRVTFPLTFELQNGTKHSSGKVLKTLLLEVHGEDLEIVSVNEKKAR